MGSFAGRASEDRVPVVAGGTLPVSARLVSARMILVEEPPVTAMGA